MLAGADDAQTPPQSSMLTGARAQSALTCGELCALSRRDAHLRGAVNGQVGRNALRQRHGANILAAAATDR
jgi:hypothetical protein